MEANPARHEDSRDDRTQQGIGPHPVEQRDTLSERVVQAPADDEVDAANPMASPSSYTQRDIDKGDTPDDAAIDMMVDPSLGRERMSTNMDVLDLDDSWRVESEEPDFMSDPGTTDVIQSVEEGEPYFPPTDPPLTTKPLNNARIVGGFSTTSLEEPTEPEDHPLRLAGDDEIAEQVRYALAADAYTAELNIEVEVRDGVVYLHGNVTSLDDIEQAEQVAGEVEGVQDVEEDLEIV